MQVRCIFSDPLLPLHTLHTTLWVPVCRSFVANGYLCFPNSIHSLTMLHPSSKATVPEDVNKIISKITSKFEVRKTSAAAGLPTRLLELSLDYFGTPTLKFVLHKC